MLARSLHLRPSTASNGVLTSEAMSVMCCLRVPLDWPFLCAEADSQGQGGSMTTFAVGVVITVVVLAGFGFVSTVSAGWFFKYRKPHDGLPTTDKNH
jgi:hypothetical protein